MNYPNVIFDMDGVLVDSEHAITLSALSALHEFGVDAVYNDFKEFTGMGEDMFIGGVARKYGHEFRLDMKARCYEIYVRDAGENVYVYPHTKSVLDKLHTAGIKMAVASAADLIKVQTNLGCIGVNDNWFAAIVTGSDVVRKKPHPDIFLKAARLSEMDHAVIMVVEDALSGIAAAKAAGFLCTAVTTSFSREMLKEAGADYVIDDLEELTAIILS